jgi:hypothetical protein
VHDQLATGRKIRVLTIVDTFTRFSPALEPRFSYPSGQGRGELRSWEAAWCLHLRGFARVLVHFVANDAGGDFA